jgi:hypothetical protein
MLAKRENATPQEAGKQIVPAKREDVLWQETSEEQAASLEMPTRLRIAGQICEGQVLEESPARRDVRVTVIRGGASINGSPPAFFSHSPGARDAFASSCRGQNQ